jgi:hypothetical protein
LASGFLVGSAVFQFWQLPDFGNFGDLFTTFCLRPSARRPPPIEGLLKTKGKPQFDRAVTELSKLVFCVFQPSNLAQFSALFPVSTVRSAEGRNPAFGFVWPIASCQLLAAFLSKIFTAHTLKALSYYSCFLRPNQLRIRTCP